MHEYGITCSYDEFLRFKKSAPVAVTSGITHQGISKATHGLVQVVSDNFDCDDLHQTAKKLHAHYLWYFFCPTLVTIF